MATSAPAALLSPWALPVPSAGGATWGRSGRCPLGQRTDAWFLCGAGGSGAGRMGNDRGCPLPKPAAPRAGGGPKPTASLPCPVHLGTEADRRSHSHAGSTSPPRGTQHRASTGLCSHSWGTAQRGLGRSRLSLEDMALGGCAAPGMAVRTCTTAQPPPRVMQPLRTTTPLGTAALGTPGTAAVASPPAGAVGLAPDPSAEGHGGCGEELCLAPWLTRLDCPPRPTLVLGIAQPCAPAAAACLPATAVPVAPAPCPLLPGWHGRGGPCEADGARDADGDQDTSVPSIRPGLPPSPALGG